MKGFRSEQCLWLRVTGCPVRRGRCMKTFGYSWGTASAHEKPRTGYAARPTRQGPDFSIFLLCQPQHGARHFHCCKLVDATVIITTAFKGRKQELGEIRKRVRETNKNRPFPPLTLSCCLQRNDFYKTFQADLIHDSLPCWMAGTALSACM